LFTRLIVDDHGAFVTTDAISIERFEEIASAVRGVLDTGDRSR
jgi:hypothetical protein